MKPLALLAVAASVAINVLSDLGYGAILFGFLTGYPGGDAVGHIVLAGVLSFAVNGAFGRRAHPFWAPRMTPIILLAVTAEELSQAIIPTRSLSLVDLLASYAGVIIGAKAAWSFLARTAPDPLGRGAASPLPARRGEEELGACQCGWTGRRRVALG